ncbi:hypothetical protein Acr_00g0031860 [Actinidia rufa]|uniref:Uncharacterized protein n=1 Tax=Actinidia rufa TaxID=165716 RepID=A0A7J0DF85_9ERIC|nr:hypothetical protein Acr_00g0031860 [Actinidia rufa]
MFISAFNKMNIGRDKLHPFHIPLVRFGGNTMHPVRWLKLPVTLGTKPHQTTVWQDFIVVDCPLPSNAILGHPTLGGIKVITSTYHLIMKFPISIGVGEQLQIDDAEMEALRDEVEEITITALKEIENKKPLEEVTPNSIHPNYPGCHVMIGTELTEELRSALVEFLKKNYGVFEWSQGDVPGINPQVTIHKLFTDLDHSPIRQKRRKLSNDLTPREDFSNGLLSLVNFISATAACFPDMYVSKRRNL